MRNPFHLLVQYDFGETTFTHEYPPVEPTTEYIIRNMTQMFLCGLLIVHVVTTF